MLGHLVTAMAILDRQQPAEVSAYPLLRLGAATLAVRGAQSLPYYADDTMKLGFEASSILLHGTKCVATLQRNNAI